MSQPPERLSVLEERLAEHLLAFVLLDKAWPHGLTAIARAQIGRQRNEVLAEIAALQGRISSVPSETLADVVEPARA